jgi:hypothetical protein
MFGLFKKAPTEDEQYSEKEFFSTLKKLEAAPPAAIVAIAVALEFVMDMFQSKYPSISKFALQSKQARMDYLTSLLNAEKEFEKQGKPDYSVAAKLFGLYLSTFMSTRMTGQTEMFDAISYILQNRKLPK